MARVKWAQLPKGSENNCIEDSSQPIIFPNTWELCFQVFPNSAMTFLWWTECILVFYAVVANFQGDVTFCYELLSFHFDRRLAEAA